MWYIYTMEYYSAIKKNDVMPFEATWMELETLILSEISQNGFIFCLSVCLFVCFSGLHLRHIEIPRLRVESELQLPDYTTVTVSWDPSCICDLHHSSLQHWSLSSLNEDRDQTHVFMDTSQVHYCWAMMGTPKLTLLCELLWTFTELIKNAFARKYLMFFYIWVSYYYIICLDIPIVP